MSNLQSLIDKVRVDTERACDEILAENKIECDNLMAKRAKEADAEYNEIIEKAHSEASILRDRMVSSEELKIRNKKLNAKQESIDSILKELYSKLLNLNEKKYLQYLKNGLSTIDEVEGAEVIVSEKYRKSSEKIIKDMGHDFKISQETLKENDGFKVIKGKVTMDFTYLKVIDFYKEDLEKIIIKEFLNRENHE